MTIGLVYLGRPWGGACMARLGQCCLPCADESRTIRLCPVSMYFSVIPESLNTLNRSVVFKNTIVGSHVRDLSSYVPRAHASLCTSSILLFGASGPRVTLAKTTYSSQLTTQDLTPRPMHSQISPRTSRRVKLPNIPSPRQSVPTIPTGWIFRMFRQNEV